MITMFVDRRMEIKSLNKRYKQRGFEFIPIYGRRRVGKTELILQFIKNKKSIYFLATAGSKKENIENFKRVAKNVIDLSLVKNDWGAIFEYIAKTIKERIVIVIDEFPYLVETEKGLSSIFQYMIDTNLKNTNIFLILCGSSLSMMYKEVLSYKAPLYGRRTGQLEINPLRFKDVVEFFKNKSMEEIIKIYSISGGVPAYLKEFTENKDLFKLVKEKILEKDAPLKEEVQYILRQEFRDPKTYMAILSAISLGNRNLGKIINYCGFPNKQGIMPYIYSLESLKYVKRDIPITESLRSKKGLYSIPDNFFNFWFRFVRRNLSTMEINMGIVIDKIKEDFNIYVSFVFEDVCKEFLIYTRFFEFTKIGGWWHKDVEIDICATNESKKQILFGECKWKDKVNAREIAKQLDGKTKYVNWYKDERKETLVIFAKSFSKRITQLNNKPVKCFDLKDLETILKKQ